jgi:hypothetical protein
MTIISENTPFSKYEVEKHPPPGLSFFFLHLVLRRKAAKSTCFHAAARFSGNHLPPRRITKNLLQILSLSTDSITGGFIL